MENTIIYIKDKKRYRDLRVQGVVVWVGGCGCLLLLLGKDMRSLKLRKHCD